MNVRDLSIKFASYAHFIASREWAREEVRLPQLICIAPDIAQEKRIQRVMQARLKQVPALVVCTTTEVLLNEHGLGAPIWLLHTPGCAHGVVPGSALRRGWSALISPSNALWGVLRADVLATDDPIALCVELAPTSERAIICNKRPSSLIMEERLI